MSRFALLLALFAYVHGSELTASTHLSRSGYLRAHSVLSEPTETEPVADEAEEEAPEAPADDEEEAAPEDTPADNVMGLNAVDSEDEKDSVEDDDVTEETPEDKAAESEANGPGVVSGSGLSPEDSAIIMATSKETAGETKEADMEEEPEDAVLAQVSTRKRSKQEPVSAEDEEEADMATDDEEPADSNIVFHNSEDDSSEDKLEADADAAFDDGDDPLSTHDEDEDPGMENGENMVMEDDAPETQEDNDGTVSLAAEDDEDQDQMQADEEMESAVTDETEEDAPTEDGDEMAGASEEDVDTEEAEES